MKKKYLGLIISAAILAAGVNPAFAAEDGLTIGGSVRANYSYKVDNDASEDKAGDFDFNLLGIKFQDKFENIGVVAEYRFMKDYDFLKYGYAYWDASEDLTVKGGLISKPFGNKNYSSHNWWYSLNYYMGFEDDYGMGLSAEYETNGWLTEASFIQKAAYGGTDNRDFAGTIASGNINGTQYNNEENNTFDVRQSYTMTNGDLTAMLGVSLEYGDLYNSKAGESGDTFNYAAHADFNYSDWNVQLQYLDFDYDQYDDGVVDTNKIGMGMLLYSFEVASKGQIYTANIAKKFKTSWGSFTVYNDFSMITPDTDDNSFDDSVLNSTGVSISYKKLFAYVDYYTAKNVVWLGGSNSLGLEQANDDWEHRFNINVAYYF
jgi:hypothetical protein